MNAARLLARGFKCYISAVLKWHVPGNWISMSPPIKVKSLVQCSKGYFEVKLYEVLIHGQCITYSGC